MCFTESATVRRRQVGGAERSGSSPGSSCTADSGGQYGDVVVHHDADEPKEPPLPEENAPAIVRMSDLALVKHNNNNNTLPRHYRNKPASPAPIYSCLMSPVSQVPANLQVHQVSLSKDSVYEDFGFSVSDGLYERGIYINRIRKGGPADLSGQLKAFDRILQVNDTRTYDFDCCLTVPLIAAAGESITLLVGRNPLSDRVVDLKEGNGGLDWEEEEEEEEPIPADADDCCARQERFAVGLRTITTTL